MLKLHLLRLVSSNLRTQSTDIFDVITHSRVLHSSEAQMLQTEALCWLNWLEPDSGPPYQYHAARGPAGAEDMKATCPKWFRRRCHICTQGLIHIHPKSQTNPDLLHYQIRRSLLQRRIQDLFFRIPRDRAFLRERFLMDIDFNQGRWRHTSNIQDPTRHLCDCSMFSSKVIPLRRLRFCLSSGIQHR